MNIFIIGLPGSGRTTVAKSLSEISNINYVDAVTYLKSSFRDKTSHETFESYNEEFNAWLSNKLKNNPLVIPNMINSIIDSYNDNSTFVIDGIFSPKDFISLFDYNQDVIVILNCLNNDKHCADYENIGVSVIRDYCFWLASAGLIDKSNWLEYNFSIPGEKSDKVKTLGCKNTIYLVKSLDKVIEHLHQKISDKLG